MMVYIPLMVSVYGFVIFILSILIILFLLFLSAMSHCGNSLMLSMHNVVVDVFAFWKEEFLFLFLFF